jgi:hypothetical protein
MLERKKDKNNDDINSKESDSNTDISDTSGGSNNESFVAAPGGLGNQSLNEERSGQSEEITLKSSTEIKMEHIHPRVKSDAEDEEDDSVSERTHEYNVTESVIGSENSTVVPGPQLQNEEIRRRGEDSVNELGNESQDSEYSKSSTGSFVVLGLIMGTIVVLLAYSVFKSRWRNTQETKTEDFGTELVDVKKTLLPQNEFNSGSHPTIHPEADESNAKLLPDTQYKGKNAENEEAHKVEAGTTDYAVQNQKDGHGDSRPKLDIDFDMIETQSESDAINNTLKSDFQEKSLPEVVTPKKVEEVDQSGHHPLQSKKTPDKTLNPHSEESTDPFPRAVTPKKEETPDVQSVHVTSHQNGYNNVNGVSEIVAVTQPNVIAQNNYVTAYPGGMVTMPGSGQCYTPVTCVTTSIVERQPSSYIIQYRY